MKNNSKKVQNKKRTIDKPKNRYRLIDRKSLNKSYVETIKHTQSQMALVDRIFSKIIHNKPIEYLSRLIGNTIARPNAILFAAITAFLVSAVLYAMAKIIGYNLSGFEPMIAFIIGWVVGLIYDYFKLLLAGNRN